MPSASLLSFKSRLPSTVILFRDYLILYRDHPILYRDHPIAKPSWSNTQIYWV
jgi:hypothetical protein